MALFVGQNILPIERMRLWLPVAVALLCVRSHEAAVAAHERGCAPGQFPGPGSPPCTKKYHGSGDLWATPKPQKVAFPTPNPSGSLYPPCTCRMPLEDGSHRRRAAPRPAPAPLRIITPPEPGEVEVLTVDVRTANRVRCQNASIAEEVAKMMNIPVKRIVVTPWSWSLPDGNNGMPPQSNYLALVQEDHERCDCMSQSGKLMQGQGFRKVAKSDGWMVGADTAVMTVSQYRALHGKADSGSAPASAAAAATGQRGASAVPAPAPEGPPPSRVQMLTRDPCLVYLLRESTSWFKKKVAFLLGVPVDKVIIDPPPVAGTVGLLQLDSTTNSYIQLDSTTNLEEETEAKQVPVLAVRQCSIDSLTDLKERLSLIAAPAPAQANNLMAAPSPAAAVYTVLAPNNTNGTNATNATNVSSQRVNLVMKLDNINYDLLAASWQLVTSFTGLVKLAIGAAGHVPPEAVKMSLFPGSVVVEAEITPPDGVAPEAVFAFLNGTVCNATLDNLTGLSALQSVTTGIIDCNVTSLTLVDPPFDVPEANRAWIAFWSVVIEEPFAQDGAWRLLNMMNEHGTQISKLLPATLARIPQQYKALLDPQAAIKNANQTRLPPPEDKAVGFKLPNPYAEEEALKAENKRMKEEGDAAASAANARIAREQTQARELLKTVQQEKVSIKQANAKFVNAARVHVEALRAANATRGLDIVPYDVIGDPLLEGESPYPWRDQVPPPSFMLNLAQQQPVQHLQRQNSKRVVRRKALRG